MRAVIAALALGVLTLGAQSNAEAATKRKGKTVQAALVARVLPADAELALRLPAAESVPFAGVLVVPKGGTPGSIMYPANGAGDLFAGILVHAIIQGGVNSKKQAQEREQADNVLLPYREWLDGYSPANLAEGALGRLQGQRPLRLALPEETTDRAWLLDVAPAFMMTQDQQGLVIDNLVVLRAPEDRENIAYQRAVRVVADSQATSGSPSYWLANGGERLAAATATLFAQSLELALEDASVEGGLKPSGTARTFRYQEGGIEKMERADPIRSECGRVVIRNLRGWLVSVPQPNTPETCPAADETPALLPESGDQEVPKEVQPEAQPEIPAAGETEGQSEGQSEGQPGVQQG